MPPTPGAPRKAAAVTAAARTASWRLSACPGWSSPPGNLRSTAARRLASGGKHTPPGGYEGVTAWWAAPAIIVL
jgi:hypothetical protein